ncbi:MAG TPA: DUF4390 domain-containing protein [Burkholderiaceae bacterium]|nr:DUF4390 domain-containing protein [Burkholderiaceae bacterium]HPH14325.1 DUF4390 domain-containing protein [Burkholderiaceae bacterium]
MLFWACLIAGLSRPAHADPLPAEISQFRVERMTDGVFLSAAIRFDLPPAVEDALLKGVPMFFVTEADLFRDRWYWADKKVVTAQRQVRLAYQPLTRRWRVTASSGASAGVAGAALSQSFDSLNEALISLQRVSRWKIAEPFEVEPGSRHNVELRFRLDVTQLPRPFQIGALGQSDWDISANAFQRLPVEPEK